MIETRPPASFRSARPGDPDDEKASDAAPEDLEDASVAASFEALVAATPAICFVKDPDGRYVHANAFLVEHLGEPPEACGPGWFHQEYWIDAEWLFATRAHDHDPMLGNDPA